MFIFGRVISMSIETVYFGYLFSYTLLNLVFEIFSEIVSTHFLEG